MESIRDEKVVNENLISILEENENNDRIFDEAIETLISIRNSDSNGNSEPKVEERENLFETFQKSLKKEIEKTKKKISDFTLSDHALELIQKVFIESKKQGDILNILNTDGSMKDTYETILEYKHFKNIEIIEKNGHVYIKYDSNNSEKMNRIATYSKKTGKKTAELIDLDNDGIFEAVINFDPKKHKINFVSIDSMENGFSEYQEYIDFNEKTRTVNIIDENGERKFTRYNYLGEIIKEF